MLNIVNEELNLILLFSFAIFFLSMIYLSFHSFLIICEFLVCIIQRGASLTFWVAPLNTFPPVICQSPLCLGLTPLTPFDNLQYAFRDGIAYAIKAKDNSVTFNLMVTSAMTVPFRIFMNYFQASPFENYNG